MWSLTRSQLQHRKCTESDVQRSEMCMLSTVEQIFSKTTWMNLHCPECEQYEIDLTKPGKKPNFIYHTKNENLTETRRLQHIDCWNIRRIIDTVHRWNWSNEFDFISLYLIAVDFCFRKNLISKTDRQKFIQENGMSPKMSDIRKKNQPKRKSRMTTKWTIKTTNNIISDSVIK